MRFEFPWAFLLLPVIALSAWYSLRKRTTASLRFSAVKNAKKSGSSFRATLRLLPLGVRILALVLLTIGLARPQEGREQMRNVSKGIAIEMVVDRSGSMREEFDYEGARLSKLQAVKKIFGEFALGNGRDLKGRPNDLIGIISFARYADTVCPLTLSHGALDPFIKSIHPATKEEDGTSIGDAVALAAARLKTIEEQLKASRPKPKQSENIAGSDSSSKGTSGESPPIPDTGYEIKSKVIILLTDGQNNMGKRSPEEAARLAKKWGIKVYAIGIGGSESYMTLQTPLGDYKVPAGPGVDEATLKSLASETGGAFWMAESAGKLHEIYGKIDKLERSEIESTRYVDYAERFYPFALAALLALMLEQVLTSTVFRRIP